MRLARQWLLLLCPAALCAGPAHFARVAEFAGGAQVQVHAYDAWQPAVRNLPLLESSRVATPAASHLQLDLDEGSSLRLVGDSLAELSDYAQLSTGQRVTLISLDHGTAYFSGQPRETDSLGIAVPGAQILLRRAARLRFVLTDAATEIAILDGVVRFSTPTAELELRQGQFVTLNPSAKSRFHLFREIPELPSDSWRDTRSAELELAGNWVHSEDFGLIWKPKVADGWSPFRQGEWRWYSELGFTWVAAEPWGWKPYHSGRWLRHPKLGWVWSPGDSDAFKPGEVYWMVSKSFAAWGPLAPGEHWDGRSPARQYAALTTALAPFTAGQVELRPAADLPKPKDLLAAASFIKALPSPPFDPDGLDPARSPLRSAGTKLLSFSAETVSIPGVSYTANPPADPPAPPPAVRRIPPPATPVAAPVPVPVAVAEPVEIYYPFPVYSGFVILNPPDHKKKPAPNAAH